VTRLAVLGDGIICFLFLCHGAKYNTNSKTWIEKA
jgi:hypothetical protein